MNARRTTRITFTGVDDTIAETVRVCWPDCAQTVLTDEQIPHPKPQGGRYPNSGTAAMTVAWSGRRRTVTWRRYRRSCMWCDLCGDAWTMRVSDGKPPPDLSAAG